MANESLASRLRELLAEYVLSEAELGRRAGVPQPTIHRIINGDSKSPRRGTVEAIARALNVSAEWLWSGNIPFENVAPTNVANGENPAQRGFWYPEISWVQAGQAREATESPNRMLCLHHQSDAWATEEGFWLKVEGPSMTAFSGISFPEGMLILVYPGLEPENGKFCVARTVDGKEATFKQFVRDAGRYYLKPLNPSFPMIEMDDTWEMVGKVVDARWPKSAIS